MAEETQDIPEETERATIPPRKIENDGKPKSLLSRVDSIEDNLNRLTGLAPTKEQKKRFKFPGFVKRQTRNLKKLMEKNKVQAIVMKLSGGLQPTIADVSMGRIIVGEFYWDAADDYVWQWLGKTPTALLPEWDMKPLTKRRLVEDTNKLKTWIHPQTIILRQIAAMRADEGRGKFQFKPMMWIIIGVVLIAAYYIFFGGK